MAARWHTRVFGPQRSLNEKPSPLSESSEHLLSSPSEESMLPPSRTAPSRTHRLYKLLSPAVILALLFYCCMLLSIQHFSAPPPPHPRSYPSRMTAPSGTSADALNCGNSTAEARAKGCHFDAMSWEWYPMACADPELSEEIIAAHEWDYFSSPEATEADRVPIEDVVAGKYEALWTSMDYHYRHCTYLWRKMHRAIINHKMLDSDTAVYNHTKHCEMILLSGQDRKDMNTLVEMSLATCIVL